MPGKPKNCVCRWRSDPNTDRPGIIEFNPNCPVHSKPREQSHKAAVAAAAAKGLEKNAELYRRLAKQGRRGFEVKL